MTRDQAIEYSRRALAEGISTDRIRQVLHSRGVDAPPASSELTFDAGQGQETAPVQRQPSTRTGMTVGDPYHTTPNLGERLLAGGVRAAPAVIGGALGGELLGGAGALGWFGRGAGTGAGSQISDFLAGEKPSLEKA